MNNQQIACPVCGSDKLEIKYEATYVYSYVLDEDAPGLKNTEEFLPFLYDRRDQTQSQQYIQCGNCGIKFPCYFSQDDKGIRYDSLQKALHQTSPNISNP